MKTILVPVDLSPISAEVVARAASLARAFRGRVVLLTVMVEPIFVKEYAPPPELLRRVTVGNEKAVARGLEKLEKRLARQSVRSIRVVLRGSPTRLILEQARKTKADYIVIGSHGHSAIFDLIGGGTMHGVLKRARCPVLIVPAHAKPTPSRTR